jgi:DNA-binding NarL/FixJ family response regulator
VKSKVAHYPQIRPALPKIKRILERRQTALLLLTEENDQTAYLQWLRAHGIVYRAIDEPTLVDAVRRASRGELFVQSSGSDIREDKSEVAWRQETLDFR